MKYLFFALLFCAAGMAAAQTAPAADTPAAPAPQASEQQQPGEQPPPPKKLSKEELLRNAAALEEEAGKSPKDADLRVKLGFTYVHLERTDDAQASFELAVQLDPKKAIAHYMLGLIYEKKNLRAQAIAAWKACLENTKDPRQRATAERHLHRLSQRGAQ